ncbi:ATP-dependent helicase [Mycolicibacterium confluentis]|uniref:DNA 3'-5' helicase n=1 Tax=Mycolicibacterium confluentis TaxID=28047 RepID=A0A7I7XZP9_9MYCO|nr:ATP-dependent DNA helicase [Mycolicibacterium confluentis]MCV7319757.1 ATP-dependent helicase [Mycolicibacterium confluentis]ORV34342.1 ATP-dependent DNA helicase [Mycolicibacterium confluentis]BBZ34787.1 ATP-dependent DNA helicase [Mycolicibacterium confluentis]
MPQYSPAELADALGLPTPTDEQAAVISAPLGPLVVIAGAGAGKTETMAARVVWLVANGYATPDQVLGLTFTRKAAGQLLRRVRSRLSRLAGTGLMEASSHEPVTVSTYHAFAGSLLRDHGLLLPVEPDTRLLSETELWQLAFDVVCAHPGDLETDKTPAAVTKMVLGLSSQLAEHMVSTDQLRDTHLELERLVHTLPPGPNQRDRGPNQWLLKMLAVQTQRAELVPLIDALHQRLRAEKAMDFGMQMSAAAQLVTRFPSVGAALRQRFRVVLLDEYQDTGHAQRVALSALFGGGVDESLALTAVGDPIQSIYGWRGASATNLPRFATDFPCADGTPAPTLELRTSWRNPPSTLQVANAISAEARRRSVEVRELRARPDAGAGTVRCALCSDVAVERDWVADQMAQAFADAGPQNPPTAAVLVRRNADAVPMAEALRARGLPVEVVGLAGLLAVEEVADVVAMLRTVADPTAGAATMRVLTGPRWRLGARDLTALWNRARDLDDRPRDDGSVDQVLAQLRPDTDVASLADAICDPGPAEEYSAAGYERICALAEELTVLRGHLDRPVPDLVAEVRRRLGVDTEARAKHVGPDSLGAEQLDAFAAVVDAYAARTPLARTDIHGLLGYLTVAEDVENGLAPAEVSVSADRIQILTVHAAKGLEWEIVAVPHLSARVFPSTANARTWLTDPADLPPLLRGDRAELGAHGVPVLDTDAVTHRKQLSDTIDAHRAQLEQRRIDEERRLLYVAITRSEDTLLLSGHHWGATETKPRGPSDFLCELKDIIETAAAEGRPCGEVVQWAADPPSSEQNPLRDNVVEASWPVDPLAGNRSEVERGAALVAAAMDEEIVADDDQYGWVADVDALLAERAEQPAAASAALPNLLSVSTLVELGKDAGAALARLNRRVPQRPDPHSLLGTAFHDWVQRFYGADRLFDLDDLPGAVDGEHARAQAEELADLQAEFMSSRWAARTPIDIEVPFEMTVAGRVVRGRIDAVFADDDGFTVVDWKTGAPPADADGMRTAAIQLAVYRLAWAALNGCEESSVRGAFHYVRSGQTVEPEDLPSREELEQMLRDADPAATTAGAP